jgi:hypothetical protein
MATTDARPIPLKNTAYRVTFPIFDADGDLVTGAATLDSEVSLDGGTFGDCTNEATEIATSSGMYFLDLTAAEMNADTVAVIVKTGTAGAKTTPIVLYPEETGDIRVTVSTGGISATSFATGAIDATAIGTGAIDADAIATDAIGSAEFAQAAADKVWSSAARTLTALGFALANTDFAANAIDAAALATDAVSEIADGVWDEDIEAAHGTDATAGLLLRVLGAAISNRANNATLDALLGVADTAGADVPSQTTDEVWEEDATDHQTQGTFGQAIGDPGADPDTIWDLSNTNLDATISSRATPAQVNTEVSDVMKIDTIAEMAQQAPPATPTFEEAVMYVYMALRNKLDVTSTLKEFHNDAGTVIWKKTLSDSGTEYSEAEGVTGP